MTQPTIAARYWLHEAMDRSETLDISLPEAISQLEIPEDARGSLQALAGEMPWKFQTSRIKWGQQLFVPANSVIVSDVRISVTVAEQHAVGKIRGTTNGDKFVKRRRPMP